jgi:uncharacterized delta-60 repeat protein
MKKFLLSFFSLACNLIAFPQAASFDNTFDDDGKVSIPIGTSADIAYAVALQSLDNKLVLAGNSYTGLTGGGYDFSVLRLNTDGSPDNSFDGDGKLTLPVGDRWSYATAVAVQPGDGKIVVAGYAFNGTNDDFAVVRLNTDGSPDNTFDADGIKLIPVGNGLDRSYSMVIQSDGKILLAGQAYNGANYDFAIVRLNADGSLDNTFDGDGMVLINVGASASADVAYSIAIQADGKIVLAGTSDMNFGIIRLNTNGSPDNTFDTDGKMQIWFPLSSTSSASSVIIQPSDQKIVVGGQEFIDGSFRFALLRLNTNGSIDPTFGPGGNDGDGYVNIPIGFDSYITSLAIQGNGKIVAAGYSNPTAGSGDWNVTLVRHNTNGTPDGTFNNGLYLKTIADPGAQHAYGMIIQPNGRIVLAGDNSSDVSYSDFLAIRLIGDPPPVNITCPANKTTSTSVGTCAAVVTGLEPTFTPNIPETPYSYTLTGATTGSGNGSTSGLTFNSGVTTVTYTLTNEPAKTCSFTVTVTAVTSITPSGPVNLCKGRVLLLSAETGAGLSYQWYRNNKVLAGETNSTLNVTTGGSYKVFVSGSGCSATSNTTTVTLISTPKAVISRIRGKTDICTTGSVELIAASVNGATYQWNKNGVPISGANGNSYVATEAGSYTVTVSKNGCSATSTSVVVTNSCALRMNKSTIITEATTEAGVKVYPNPSRGIFNVHYRSDDMDEKAIILRVFNMTGQLIWQQTATVAGGYMYKQITLPGEQPAGVYLVQIKTLRKLYSVKLVIQH